jgi:ABC-type Fe3+ transport system substrate-binding protein
MSQGEREITYELKNTKIDLLALMPCPIKVPFEKVVRDYLKENSVKEESRLNCIIEGHANHHLSFYDQLKTIDKIEQLPEIIIAPGINAMYFSPFKDKFIDKGYFEAVLPLKREPEFEAIQYLDPQDRYSMFTMNLLVMVVYKPLLKGAHMPTCLEEIMDSCYEKNVILRGQGDYFCETVLLIYEKIFGEEGLMQLAKNVKYACHPAQMVKLIKSGKSEGAAIYVMPYFYAKGLESNKDVEIIWPKEGAIVNAVSMLVKKDAREEVMDLAKFITGKEVGDVLSGAYFPTVYKSSYSNYMKKLLWMGWEHINNSTLEDKLLDINDGFCEIYKKQDPA